MKPTNRRPFCNRETMEAFKSMKTRELQRQGRPIPSTLLPTNVGKIYGIYGNKLLRTKRAESHDRDSK